MELRGCSQAAGGSATWYSHFEKLAVGGKVEESSSCDPAVPPLSIILKRSENIRTQKDLKKNVHSSTAMATIFGDAWISEETSSGEGTQECCTEPEPGSHSICLGR